MHTHAYCIIPNHDGSIKHQKGLSHIPVIHSDCNEWSDHRDLNLAAYNQAVLLLLLFAGFFAGWECGENDAKCVPMFLSYFDSRSVKKTYLCN